MARFFFWSFMMPSSCSRSDIYLDLSCKINERPHDLHTWSLGYEPSSFDVSWAIFSWFSRCASCWLTEPSCDLYERRLFATSARAEVLDMLNDRWIYACMDMLMHNGDILPFPLYFIKLTKRGSKCHYATWVYFFIQQRAKLRENLRIYCTIT